MVVFEVASIIGIVGGGFGILTTVVSLFFQLRQTRVMESQVDRAIEVKITRELDAPEGAIDSKLRAFLNRRLSDIRTQMRQEFGQRLDELTRILEDSHVMDRKDIAFDSLHLLSAQKDATASFMEVNDKVSVIEHDIQALQQAIEDIQNGVGNQAMARAQIRQIAQQLLQMTGQ